MDHYNFDEQEAIYSQLSAEEQQVAEESFDAILRRVELYQILESRAEDYPLFLKRCLHYKLKDKHKRRVQLSVSISRPLADGPRILSTFPWYILLARALPTPNGENSRCYGFKQACKLTASNGAPAAVGSLQARFILPDANINKLSTEFKSGSLSILLAHFATEIDDHLLSPSNGRFCLMGTPVVDFVHFARERSPTVISLGKKAELMSTVSLKSSYMKLSCIDGETRLSFHFPCNFDVVQLPITITAEALRVKDLSPSDLHSDNNISTDKLPEVPRQRTEVVLFNYKYYYNILQRRQVMDGYTCPFCDLQCASFKGLECHLLASHDLFNYEFRGGVDCQVVNVYAKATASSTEIFDKMINTRQEQFYFRSTRKRRSRRRIQSKAGPLVLESNTPGTSSAAADI